SAGVQKVEVSIQDGSGNYWKSGRASSRDGVFNLASGTTSWSYALASSALTSGHTYTIHSRATDNASNVQTTFGSATFLFDTAKPSSSVTFPANSGDYNTAGWTGSITGSASDTDSAGVQKVEVSIQDGSGNYW